MGPTIILDKSALQALSQDEIWFLAKHYFLAITPVLLIEILADLKKPQTGTLSERDVQVLAGKVTAVDSMVNAHYRVAAITSLLGGDIPMSRQVLVAGGQHLKTADGRVFTFFDEEPERVALRAWQNGRFTEADQALAERWRQSTQALDLEGTKRRLQQVLTRDPAVKSLTDIRKVLDVWSSQRDQSVQMALLNSCLDDLGVEGDVRTAVFNRWMAEGMPDLPKFAPYAFHCFIVSALFQLGILHNLVSTRSTNRIDLEYLYYSPFAMVFCSGDKFHKQLWPHVLSEDQTFVDRDELKADLKRLHQDWECLDEAQRRKRSSEYGFYPPDNPNSITYQLWRKYMRPREPGVVQNRAATMSEDEQKAIIESMRPFMDAIDRHSRTD